MLALAFAAVVTPVRPADWHPARSSDPVNLTAPEISPTWDPAMAMMGVPPGT
jgi:hypothetical protein